MLKTVCYTRFVLLYTQRTNMSNKPTLDFTLGYKAKLGTTDDSGTTATLFVMKTFSVVWPSQNKFFGIILVPPELSYHQCNKRQAVYIHILQGLECQPVCGFFVVVIIAEFIPLHDLNRGLSHVSYHQLSTVVACFLIVSRLLCLQCFSSQFVVYPVL